MGLLERTKSLFDFVPDLEYQTDLEWQQTLSDNKAFYEEHPRETLELEPLPYFTQFGRRVYKDQHGVKHSETTATVETPDGGWMNVPTIFDGKYVSDDMARKIILDAGMIDRESGSTIKTYKTIEAAEKAAQDRMKQLNDPSQPWNLEGTDWITNFPFEHLDWKGALPPIQIPHVPDWLTGRKNPNIPEVEEWNP
tara:strand:+ start:220 stop:804 length:585 start_codon:yes stop_codon:yes gene_type:complete